MTTRPVQKPEIKLRRVCDAGWHITFYKSNRSYTAIATNGERTESASGTLPEDALHRLARKLGIYD